MQTLNDLDRTRLFQSDGPAWIWRNNLPERHDGAPATSMSELRLVGAGSAIPVIVTPSLGATYIQNVQQGRMHVAVRYFIDQTFIVLDTFQ